VARIRTIKPEFWQDERLCGLSRDIRLLYIGLWNLADDHGRLRGHPAFIKGHVFPYDEDADVPAWLARLELLGRIVRYQRDGQTFIWIRKFSEHQKMDKRTDSKLPEPTAEEIETSAQKLAGPTEKGAPEWKGKEQGKEQGKEVEAPPATTTPDPNSAMGGTSIPAVAQGAEAERRHTPVVVIPPTGPADSWTAEDFWAWAQDVRQRNGYLAERPMRTNALKDWFREALLSGAKVRDLKEAFYGYGESDFWKTKKPAYPFAGFVSQWVDFMGQRNVDAA
jgi:hypothetical protein